MSEEGRVMTVEEWKRKNPPIRRKPITNADRIRAMTDEELAKWIAFSFEEFEEGWLKWLKKEAKDERTD